MSAWPVIAPHPVPLGTTAYDPYTGMFDGVDLLLNRVVTMLKSIPVIPNMNYTTLYDSNGNWYTPSVSLFDFLVFIVLITSFFVIFSRVTGSGGALLYRGVFASNYQKGGSHSVSSPHQAETPPPGVHGIYHGKIW